MKNHTNRNQQHALRYSKAEMFDAFIHALKSLAYQIDFKDRSSGVIYFALNSEPFPFASINIRNGERGKNPIVTIRPAGRHAIDLEADVRKQLSLTRAGSHLPRASLPSAQQLPYTL